MTLFDKHCVRTVVGLCGLVYVVSYPYVMLYLILGHISCHFHSGRLGYVKRFLEDTGREPDRVPLHDYMRGIPHRDSLSWGGSCLL